MIYTAPSPKKLTDQMLSTHVKLCFLNECFFILYFSVFSFKGKFFWYHPSLGLAKTKTLEVLIVFIHFLGPV